MKKTVPVIILTVISVFFIFYRFTGIPKYLAFDEVEFTKLALSLENKPYTPYSPLATGHSTLYFYILLASLKTFGINTFALRLPAAIFGVLSVLMFYLIIKRLLQQFNNITMKQFLPFLLTLIFLTSRWFLNFARFSFEATFLLFLELMSIYFFIKFREREKAKIPFLRQSPGVPFGVRRSKKMVSSFLYLILSGIFSGFAFISYTPGRIFFFLPMGFLLFRKQFNNETMKQLLLFLIPFIIIITPLTSYLLVNKDTRIDQQFFLRNHEMTVGEKVDGLWSNISSTALMFFTKGDMNGRHNYPGKPALNPVLGILFIAGLFISIRQWKNNINKIFIFYFFLSLIPALMTYPWENPNMLRTYTVLPSVVYFIGQGIIVILNLFQNPKLLRSRNKFGMTLFLIIIIFSSFYELRTYFKYQSIVFKQSFEIKLPLEKAIKIEIKP